MFASACTSAMEKPACAGTYVDTEGVRHHWTVNEAHTLMWDGKPYIPIGGAFCPPYVCDQTDSAWELTKNQIDLLKQKGVIDIYLPSAMVSPPEVLQRIIDYLDSKGFRYGIELAGYPGDGPGYSIQREGMKVADVSRSGTYRVDFGDAVGGVYVVVDDNDAILDAGNARVFRVEDTNGTRQGLEADVKCPPNRKLTLYFTPMINGGRPYFWEGGFEKYRDKLVEYFSKVRFGKGFRFVVEPVSGEAGASNVFLPASQAYTAQFTRWLILRYKKIEALNSAWAMITPLVDFEVAGRLVPVRVLKTKKGEIGVLVDPAENKVYTEDARVSQLWYDIVDFSGEVSARYCNSISEIFKKRVADVPIVFEHTGPIARHRINLEESGFDGVGVETYGIGESLVPVNTGVCWSEVEQSARNMWLVVTRFSQMAPGSQVENIGHLDRESLYADMSTLLGAGAKGIFVFGLSLDPCLDNQFWMTEYIRDPRQLEWIATYRQIVESSSQLPTYRPVYYYRFPARASEQFAFGATKADYFGLDGDWSGYTGGPGRAITRGPDGTWVVPTWSAAVETPLLIANLDDSPASLRYGPELERVIAAGNHLVTYIGFRRDLGTIPSVDKYFTERFARDIDGKRIQVLKPTPTSKVYAQTPDGDIWNLVDGNLQIISKEVEDCEGWQPEGLRIPAVEQSHEPERFLAEVLGVREFRLDPDIHGLSFLANGRPIVYLWSEKTVSVIRIPAGSSSGMRARYSNGEKAGEFAKDGSLTLRIPLKQEPEIVDAEVKYTRGKHCPTENWRDALIIDGMKIETLAKPEEVMPVYGTYVLPPDIWIEAEDFQESNFNLGKYSGITRLSGGAFWGLSTFSSPSADSGYYVNYVFDVQEEGEYDLWIREWVGMSPCHWRVNGSRWQLASESLEDEDKRFCGAWTALEGAGVIFAWRHYGKVRLEKGENTLEIRIIARRKKGDKYCKFLDAIAFLSQGIKPWEIGGNIP